MTSLCLLKYKQTKRVLRLCWVGKIFHVVLPNSFDSFKLCLWNVSKMENWFKYQNQWKWDLKLLHGSVLLVMTMKLGCSTWKWKEQKASDNILWSQQQYTRLIRAHCILVVSHFAWCAGVAKSQPNSHWRKTVPASGNQYFSCASRV